MITVNSLSELECNSVCLPSIPQELGLISSTSKKKKYQQVNTVSTITLSAYLISQFQKMSNFYLKNTQGASFQGLNLNPLLLFPHLDELCVEALCRMEQTNCSFQVFDKYPGIYLFLVHPNEMVSMGSASNGITLYVVQCLFCLNIG